MIWGSYLVNSSQQSVMGLSLTKNYLLLEISWNAIIIFKYKYQNIVKFIQRDFNVIYICSNLLLKITFIGMKVKYWYKNFLLFMAFLDLTA